MAEMVTLLITSLFIIGFVAVALYFWQKPASTTETQNLLPAPEARGLFIDGPLDREPAAAESDAEALAHEALQRVEVLERARGGEKSALKEARNSPAQDLYDEVLDALVDGADSEAKLLSLVSYVTRQELPVNKKLAEKSIASCKGQPGRSSAAKMLHMAALSDQAGVYQTAVETALDLWRSGRLPEISPQELHAILEGEFWILSSPTRSSGAGFLLKRTLAAARRELEAAHND